MSVGWVGGVSLQLFVGVWPPPRVQKVIADYPRPKVTDVRWSTPSQWLVKLRPLGHVAGALVPQLIETLRFELDGAPKVKVSMGPAATRFGGAWLHAPVQGLDDLGAVIFEVTEALIPVTHPQPFSADLVLARATKCPPELVQPISASWTVGEICLAKGTRSKDGPGYEDVEVFALGPSDPAKP